MNSSRKAKKAPEWVFCCQIKATVEDHEGADARHQQCEHEGQAVEPQVKFKADERQPSGTECGDAAAQDTWHGGCQHSQGGQRGCAGDQRNGITTKAIRGERQRRQQERNQNDPDEGHGCGLLGAAIAAETKFVAYHATRKCGAYRSGAGPNDHVVGRKLRPHVAG